MREAPAAIPSWHDWAKREGMVWAFVLRTVLAMFLGLAVALRLDLASPGSAAVTVSIVALPQTGMVLEKAVYRFIGTLLGAAVTLLLVGLFPQHEFVFLAAVGVWIGICTAISCWFRTFRAYAWLLCGYTTCLIGFPAFLDPRHAFDIAVDRVTIVSVGIFSAAIANAVVLPNPASAALQRQIRRVVDGCMAFAAAIREGGTPERIRRAQLRFSVDLGDLEQARMSSVIEDPVTGLKSPRILALSRQLMLALSRLQLLHRLRVSPVPDQPTAARARDWSRQALERDVERSIVNVRRAEARLESTQPEAGEEFFFSRVGMATDPVQALVAGLRAMLVFGLSVVFWIWADWPDGFLATLFATVLCCVLAAQPDPVRAAWQMCLGVLLCLPLTFICDTLVLPAASGLGMLFLGLLPFLVLGAWIMAQPGRALLGSAYFMIFLLALNINGVMDYDVTALLNNLAACLVGVLMALAGLAVMVPPDPRWRARRLVRRLLRTVRVARRGRVSYLRLHFENEVRELTAQLVSAHQQDIAARDELLATGVLEVGVAVIRLRQALPLASTADRTELTSCLDAVVAVVADEQGGGYAALDARLEALQARLPAPDPGADAERPDAVIQVLTGIDLLRLALAGLAEAVTSEAHGAAHAA